MAIPNTAIEVELRKLKNVAALQTESSACHCKTKRRVLPFDARDAKWIKQVLGCKILNTHFSDSFKYTTERYYSSCAVTETASVGRILRFWNPSGKSLDGQI